MFLLNFLSTIVSISSFLGGFVVGIIVCIFAVIHLLKSKPSSNAIDNSKTSSDIKNNNTITDIEQITITNNNITSLRNLIDFLDEFNSPLKNFGNYLEQVYVRRDITIKEAEQQNHLVMNFSEFTKMEKDFYDVISTIKEQTKQTKLISTFLTDISKVFSSFGKDLSKLSSTARNNMHRGGMLIDTKEEMIANNWWQALHVSLECLSNDQEYLSNHITDDLLNYSSQMHEELNVIDKRLYSEGTKQIFNMKEQLNLYESKKRERAKYLEKVNNTPPSALTTQTQEAVLAKRRLKQKINDETVIHQKKILLSTQKEFHIMMSRIHADIQLTVLKTIVDQHSQLSKVCEAFERTQNSYEMVLKRMKIQLTNAASSLVQMIREEGEFADKLKVTDITEEKLACIVSYEENLRIKMAEIGLQGYELNLQHVLSDLLKLCTNTQFQLEMQSKCSTAATAPSNDRSNSNMNEGSSSGGGGSKNNVNGRLNMSQESTSCLAASNPAILPLLPQVFMRAVGMETCVWFNSFSGRVYRDISHSKWFYNWFCRKLSAMLNKGPRPDYIDEFKVSDVKFGLLPPLLLNMQWSPHLNSTDTNRPFTRKDGSKGNDNHNTGSNLNHPESDDSDLSDHEKDPMKTTKSKLKSNPANPNTSQNHSEQSQQQMPDADYYAACNADMAFRSGIEFTISTKLWINWPRDRYASVPVTLHLNLAECSGPIRFGVTKGYSFFSFIGDPVMRINVRNEIGKGVFHIKDMPQISDFIVKKLKSFIHRKIVHPNSHKFRLIWPRNWWPEGTQDSFTEPKDASGQTMNSTSNTTIPSSEINSKDGVTPIKVDLNKNNATVLVDQSEVLNRYTRSQSDATTSSLPFDQIEKDPSNLSSASAATSSSSYESIKYKVTNWLQKSKERRNSKLQKSASISENIENNKPVTTISNEIDMSTVETNHILQSSENSFNNKENGIDRRKYLVSRAIKNTASDRMNLLLNSARQTKTFQRITSKFVRSEAIEFEREENETTELALQSLSRKQQEVLKDNVAWDIAVKSISMKYIEQQYQVPSKASSTVVSSTRNNLHPLDSHTQKCAIRALNADYPIKTPTVLTTTLTEIDNSRMIYSEDFNHRKIARRHSSDADLHEINSAITFCGSNQKQLPIEQPYDISIPRIHSISDFRSSVVDAMFVLHIVNTHHDIKEVDYLNEVDHSEEEVVVGDGDGDGDESTSRNAISLSDPTDVDAYRRSDINSNNYEVDSVSIDPNSKVVYSEGRIAGSISTPNKWKTNIIVAKNKFADFKAKHLNNREFSQVFKRNQYGNSSNNANNTFTTNDISLTRERRNSSISEENRNNTITTTAINNNITNTDTTSSVVSPQKQYSESIKSPHTLQSHDLLRTSPGGNTTTTTTQSPTSTSTNIISTTSPNNNTTTTTTSAAMKYVSSIFRSHNSNTPNNK